MNIYEKIAENLYRPLHRINIVNSSRLKIDSPTIFIINHQSVSEPFAVYRAIKNYCGVNARFLAMNELFKTPIVKDFLKALDFIPVNRNSSSAKDSLTEAIKFLSLGGPQVLALYPEGELSRDKGNLNIRHFKSGAARIALNNPDIKVIPVAQSGTAPGKLRVISNIFTRPEIKIKFGGPLIIPEELYNANDRAAAVELTKMFEAEVAKLYEEIK